MKYLITLTAIVLCTACSPGNRDSDSNPKGGGSGSGSGSITSRQLISNHWCQTAYRKDFNDPQLLQPVFTQFLTRVFLSTEGILNWQAHSVGSFFQ